MIRARTVIFFAAFAFFIHSETSFAKVSKPARNDYLKGAQELERGEYDAAIESFKKALTLETQTSEQARIYNLIGVAYLRQKVSVSSALGSFEQAIQLDPKYAEAYFNLASTYANEPGKEDEAEKNFRKALEVDPQYQKAHFGIGWFYLSKKRNADLAVQHFEKAAAHNPKFAEAQYALGLAYIQSGKSYLALGSLGKLRMLKRDDLAGNLEKALAQLPSNAPEPPPASAADKNKQPAAVPDKKGTITPIQIKRQGRVVPLPPNSPYAQANAPREAAASSQSSN